MLHVFDFVNMVPNIVSQYGSTKQKDMHNMTNISKILCLLKDIDIDIFFFPRYKWKR